MFRTLFIAAAMLVLASARPEIVGMFEKEITEALQEFLGPLDPANFTAIKDVNISYDNASLIFNFEDVTLSGFSGVECTKFTPPLLTKEVKLSLKEAKSDLHANSYTTEGTLNGNPLSASGTADLVINNYGFNLEFKAESYNIGTPSLCIAEGSLDLDLFLGSVEANFENASDLNDELNTNGSAMIESLQALIMQNADQIVDTLNTAICKKTA